MDYHEIIAQFRSALSDNGIVPPDHIKADGEIHRCDAEGRGGRGDASYVLHLDGHPAGGYVNWRGGEWTAWKPEDALSPADQAARRRDMRSKAEARKEFDGHRRLRAARDADSLWRHMSPCVSHPYLSRKRVKPHGARVDAYGNLVIPVRDIGGALQSLQFIAPDGSKRFLRGGRVQGCFHRLDAPGAPIPPGYAGEIGVAEGFATAATIQEWRPSAVVAAFNCGNLKPVAAALRLRCPGAAIRVYADDDTLTPGNPGLTHAMEAAAACGGRLLKPDWGRLPAPRPPSATDFNDLALLLQGAP